MDNTSIQVTNLGIKFFLELEPSTLRPSILFPKKKKDFWALKNINLSIQKGEIFGIIGGNAAGKSTLLKIIAGIYPATQGNVRITGSIAPLIELGAAFNPELTGEENIYLSGSIYKIPRQVIQQNIARIIDFSGLKKFIGVPVKNYSSGMFVRLAFSIVIFFKPDIVLIDEVFAVGDEAFQQKSFEKILSFSKTGATIVLVTHDSKLITQICDRALVLKEGEISFLGEAQAAVHHYRQLLKSGQGLDTDTRIPQPTSTEMDSKRWGSKQVEITEVQFVDKEGIPKNIYQSGDYFEARISYTSHQENITPTFGVAINTAYKLLIYGPNTLEANLSEQIPPEGTIRFIIPSLPLFSGDYLFSAAVYDHSLKEAFDHHDMMYHFRVESHDVNDFGCVRINSIWKIGHE